jgi:outer membrane receptor protein involved in Fe transport
VTAGLDFREVRGASDEVAYVAGRPSSFIGAGGRERTAGFFVQDIVRIQRRFILTIGGRFDRWRNFASQSVTRPIRAGAPTAVTIFPDRSESAFSPRGSLLFQASPRFSAYVSGYRAFRQPTLNELYRSFRVGDVLTLANERLRAERLTGAEAGAIFSGAEGRLNLRGTIFLAYITRPVANTTVSVTPALITRIRENLGRTRSNGFELEGEWRAHRYWTISAGSLFVEPTVVRFPENVQLEGLLLPQVARNNVSFQITYSNPRVATIAAQGRFVSKQFDDDLNRFELKPFFLQDLFASRKIGERFEAFVATENLFNTRIEAGKTPVTTLGAPRLVRAGLRFHFAGK